MKCPKCQFDNPLDSKFCKECGTQLPSAEKASMTKTLETPLEGLTPGSVFAGRYQIIEELGKGGMGKIYRALDKKLNEEVALKLIKPEIASDPKTLERFHNELKLARKISHTSIGRMHELMEEGGINFITMEYVPGEDLKSFIRRSRQLAVGTAIAIGKQTCEGLAAAHRLGVVHRDLKPSNIMIDREGNVKIMDFGIARTLGEKGITGAGLMIGTPEYMSPEQVEGEEVDQRSDIYSLGIILYEMVTGRLPFEGEMPLSMAIKHKSEVPRDPKQLNAQIPADFSQMILKCMKKDKKDRYQTAEELLSALKRIEEGTSSAERAILRRKIITPREITVTFRLKKFLMAGLAVIIIAALAILLWRVFPRKQDSLSSAAKHSVAVLPFTDLSPEKDQEYFCDGLAEELINRLTKVEGLWVPARTSAFSFKDKNLDIQEIGTKLNVKTALEGSLRKAGNKMRITVRLVNVADGTPLWSEVYERDEGDIFALQDEISLAILSKLRIKLMRAEKAKLVRRYTVNLKAYNLYLQGLFFLNKRTEEGVRRAIDYFQKAIEEDPSYALAYVGLADSHSILGSYGWLPPKEVYPKAKAMVEKALEIDSSLGEAHASLGMINTNYDWDWSAAEIQYRRAIELNPNYANAHQWFALHLAHMARFEEAMSEVRRAQELDPLSLPIMATVGSILFYQREYDHAVDELSKALEIDPNFGPILGYLGRIYAMKEHFKEAIDLTQKAIRNGGYSWGVPILAATYAKSGEKSKAEELLHELEALSRKKYVPASSISLIYGSLGALDKVFELAEKAYQERDPVLHQIKVLPELDIIRSDPRFKALLKKMNLD